MYGLDACHLSKSQLNSLDFVINRLFMKLFETNNMDIIKYCQSCFDFEMPSALWAKRANKLNENIKYDWVRLKYSLTGGGGFVTTAPVTKHGLHQADART